MAKTRKNASKDAKAVHPWTALGSASLKLAKLKCQLDDDGQDARKVIDVTAEKHTEALRGDFGVAWNVDTVGADSEAFDARVTEYLTHIRKVFGIDGIAATKQPRFERRAYNADAQVLRRYKIALGLSSGPPAKADKMMLEKIGRIATKVDLQKIIKAARTQLAQIAVAEIEREADIELSEVS